MRLEASHAPSQKPCDSDGSVSAGDTCDTRGASESARGARSRAREARRGVHGRRGREGAARAGDAAGAHAQAEAAVAARAVLRKHAHRAQPGATTPASLWAVSRPADAFAALDAVSHQAAHWQLPPSIRRCRAAPQPAHGRRRPGTDDSSPGPGRRVRVCRPGKQVALLGPAHQALHAAGTANSRFAVYRNCSLHVADVFWPR